MGSAIFLLFRKEFSALERIFLIGALVAYAVQGIVVFDNLFTYVPLAALLAYIHTRTARPFNTLERAPLLLPAATETSVAVASVVALTVVWVVNVPGLLGGMSIIQSFATPNDPATSLTRLKEAVATGSFGTQEIREQMATFAITTASRAEVPPEVRKEVLVTTVTELQKELVRAPRDARLRLQYATVLRAGGDVEGALAEINAALQFSPKKQTLLLEKGVTYLQVNRFEEARDAFYEAYNLDTSFAQTAAYAAAGDILVGNMEAADTLLATHFPDSLAEVPQVVLVAYQSKGQQDKALAILADRERVANNSLESQLQTASTLAQFGRIQEAKKKIEDIVAAYPNMAAAAADWNKQIDSLGQ